ncbi:MAG: hypothetical protein LBL95_07175, partial [Deltaproteobacteria bacterium]|nr:hypothetical protein [Deltaproteobacteria bacterium]
MPNAHKNLSLALAPLLLSLMLLAPGCGVFSDLARDNQLHIGSLGLKDFISPVKLRVGILDLRDEVGLGSPEAGSNLAVLLTERFSENGDLVLVTPAEVSAAARARGWNGEELSPEMAMELGRELDLNVIMEGAISQVEQQAARRGWRRLIRFITDQQKYVDAVITLVAYDSATGLVISSRAGEGSYKVGQSEVDPFATTPEPAISQEAIEQGLELAIDDTYYRTLDGLAYTPFK